MISGRLLLPSGGLPGDLLGCRWPVSAAGLSRLGAWVSRSQRSAGTNDPKKKKFRFRHFPGPQIPHPLGGRLMYEKKASPRRRIMARLV